MKVIDRYLAREFTRNFLVVLGIVACLLLIAEIIDSLGDMLENETSLYNATRYLAASLPLQLLEVVPMATIVATLFTVGGLARNNEILAMLTGGVSIYRVALPFVAVGIAISLGSILVGELVASRAQRLASYLERVYIEGKIPRNRNQDIVASGIDNSTYAIQNYRYDERGEYMQDVSIWWMRPDRWTLKRRFDAQTGIYQGEAEDGRTIWDFERVVDISYDHRGNIEEMKVFPFDEKVTMYLSPNLNVYLRERLDPEEMNFRELSRYIETLRARGVTTASYETDRHLKIAYPFSAVLLILIGMYCGMKAQKGSLVVGFGLGLVAAVVYFLTTALFRAFGHAGLGVPGAVFAWTPSVLFGVMAVWLLVRAGKPS